MSAAGAENAPPIDWEEQEEVLAALIEFRSKEVERFRLRLEYYKSQVEDAEKKLNDCKAKLALLRSHSGAPSLRSPLEAKGSTKPSAVNGGITVKEEETTPARGSERLRPQPPVAAPPPEQPPPQPQSRPPLIIPAVRPNMPSSTDAKAMGRAGRPEAMVVATSASVVASSRGVLGTRASPSHNSSDQPGEATNRGAPSWLPHADDLPPQHRILLRGDPTTASVQEGKAAAALEEETLLPKDREAVEEVLPPEEIALGGFRSRLQAANVIFGLECRWWESYARAATARAALVAAEDRLEAALVARETTVEHRLGAMVAVRVAEEEARSSEARAATAQEALEAAEEEFERIRAELPAI
ncbi:hypothetical protein Taro_001137 [Colocasia esculenta]|uniref:Uncharacterized protein n=1 Tax=Colocasia esculenta TaxID=4460 RepID=A0A843TDU9_COLES|nr:hypothetical protein [Colocasia esculenta]